MANLHRVAVQLRTTRVARLLPREGPQDRVPRRLWHLLRPLWRATDLGGKALQRRDHSLDHYPQFNLWKTDPAGTDNRHASHLTTFAPNISLPLLNFFSLGVDRQIGKGATISIPYRGNINLNLFRSLDVNAPLYPWSSSLRPDPSFGFVRQIQSRGHQFSNALDFTFRGSISHWFSGLAQYTLGRTWNNSGGLAWFPANQYDDTGEYTRADFDQLHRLNIPGTINEGHSASLGVAANLNSGSPYTETSGVDTLRTGLLNQRPAGVPRNSLQASGYVNLDLRWSHDFQLRRKRELPVITFAVDASNLPNRTNYIQYVGNVQSGFYGLPTSALPAKDTVHPPHEVLTRASVDTATAERGWRLPMRGSTPRPPNWQRSGAMKCNSAHHSALSDISYITILNS